MGFENFSFPTQILFDWLLTHGTIILGIVIVAFVAEKFAETIVTHTIRKAIKSSRYSSKEAEKKREDTIINLLYKTLKIVIPGMAFLMILSEIGINISPLIAGAGIIGIALGFGGQYLIKDIISGLFIIIENQYRVGDVVCFGDTCGLVEDVNIRTTVLRDLDGTVHHVPNGEIKIASNLSKGYSRVNLNIGVAYNTNLEKVISVINEVGQNLAKDKQWKEDILKPPEFLRIDNFGESEITIKILGDTKPLRQWDVTGELRKRLKNAFDKNNIEIPFPQRVIRKTN